MKRPKDRTGTGLSRRDFEAASLAVGVSAVVRPASGKNVPITETDVEVKTPDGISDAALFNPTQGSHPGVLIWHDSLGLRPAMRELGRRIADAGYTVLVPNLFYRMAKAPVFDQSFDYAGNPADRARYGRIVAPFLAQGAAERDAVAYIAFLDAQQQVDRKRKIGTHGYCLGGPYVLRAAAELPDRVGAAASIHGGFLVTAKPDSPHLLAPRIKSRLYFAIASDDDQREPTVKDQLRDAFAAAKVSAEIEVYPNARHGWCVPDSKAWNPVYADQVFAKLVALYQAAL